MKLVLREHVDHLGHRGDIVNVARGFARNYLLPKGLAYEATPGNLKTVEHQRRVWAERDAKDLADAKGLAARIGAVELQVTRKAGDTGTLFGSVTSSDVAELLGGKGFRVDRRKIVIERPIKTVGDHEVGVKIHREITARVKVCVQGETAAAPIVEPEETAEEHDED